MVKGVICRKCMIGWAIQETTKEYRHVIEKLIAKRDSAGSLQEWAHCQGQVEAFQDVINDNQSMIPYLQIEADLRARTDKGQ